MPSLDYIEKLTGIKEDWIQNLKETESALVLAVQLPPQEQQSALIVRPLQDA